MDALTRRLAGKTLAELNVDNYEQGETFNLDNPVLFRAIATVAGASYVVDSSKSGIPPKLLQLSNGDKSLDAH